MSRKSNPAFGVNFSGWGPGQDSQLAKIAQAGFSIVRSDLQTATEVVADAQVAAVATHGLRLLPIVHDATMAKWSGHPNVIGFEVWNEPNLIQPLTQPKWLSQVDHAALDGCTPTISGGLADTEGYESWLRTAHEMMGQVRLGIHPYIFPGPSTALARKICPHRPIWVTEFGVGRENITEQQRASDMHAAAEAILEVANVQALIVYSWNDPAWCVADAAGNLLPCGQVLRDLM